MARTVVLQDRFDRGIRSDDPHDAMQGALWDGYDLLPGEDSRKLTARGPWTEASNSITATTATASYVNGGIYASFATPKNLCLDEDGRLYSIATNGTVTDIGAAVVNAQNPVIHRSLVVIPAAGGATAPKSYDGTTLQNLAGSPPNAIYAAVWGDYTLLANTTANPNRLWFSDPGDPTVWDTTNSWWDFSYPITGLAALGNVILVFHEGYTSRLRGSIPPPGTDFIADDPMFAVGCSDPRSIAVFEDRVLFASASGIYMTDGAAVQDVTALCGMSEWWRESNAGYTSPRGSSPVNGVFAGGILNDYYFSSSTNSSGNSRFNAMINLRKMALWKHTGFAPTSFWKFEGGSDELYFGERTTARVRSLGSIFNPTSAVGGASGVKGVPVIYTPFYEDKPGSKGWRRVGISYKYSVTGVVGAIDVNAYSVKGSVGQPISLGQIGEGEGIAWKPVGLGATGLSFSFGLTSAVNGYWAIDAILADVNPRESSRP